MPYLWMPISNPTTETKLFEQITYFHQSLAVTCSNLEDKMTVGPANQGTSEVHFQGKLVGHLLHLPMRYGPEHL